MVLSPIGTSLPRKGESHHHCSSYITLCEALHFPVKFQFSAQHPSNPLAHLLAPHRRDCFCNYQFNVKACSVQGIFKTADVVKNDPDSVACAPNTVDVMIEQMIRFPIAPEELTRLRSLLPSAKPKRPYAFIFGHGLWNDLDLQATLDWLDLILETSSDKAPWLSPGLAPPEKGKGKGDGELGGGGGGGEGKAPRAHERKRETGFWPRLFMTPNAAGKEKPDEWIQSQGDKALMIFEESVRVEAGRRGVEHVGTWNMSVQSNKFDGV